MLDAGARMEVYPLVDEKTVLRVPRRTEHQLIAEFGSSGRVALATGHEVSIVTDTELRDLEAIEGFIGAFVPDTAPFPDLDLKGSFRYYSIQRRVRIMVDLRSCTSRLLDVHSRRSLERFIRDVRDMVESLGLLPDLVGRGNLVLDRFGLVKLIDINNFRRLVPDDEIANGPTEADFDAWARGLGRITDWLPAGFVDDLGHPIGDLSMAQLRRLEIRGLGRDSRAVDTDPFYGPLRNEERRRILGLLRAYQA